MMRAGCPRGSRTEDSTTLQGKPPGEQVSLMSDEAKKEIYIEIKFAPSWKLISDVRRFVSVFYNRTLGEPDAAGRIALAAHELLENAAKYSSDGEARLRMEVTQGGPPHTMWMVVSNRARAEEIERLQQTFGEMKQHRDPLAYYQQLIRSSRGRMKRSGLGLARIQAEADILLDLSVEVDLVSIQGSTQVEQAQESSSEASADDSTKPSPV
jgi:hypothetical protein